MVTIKLDKPWTYQTPLTTIDYAAGEHGVFQYIADAALAEGAITEEKANGGASSTATTGKKGAADNGKG